MAKIVPLWGEFLKSKPLETVNEDLHKIYNSYRSKFRSNFLNATEHASTNFEEKFQNNILDQIISKFHFKKGFENILLEVKSVLFSNNTNQHLQATPEYTAKSQFKIPTLTPNKIS